MTTQIAKPTHQQLVDAFRAAEVAALAADPGQDQDGGTCNLDSPTVKLKGMREAAVEAAAAEAGISVSKIHWLGATRYFVHTTAYGQGNRRSAMAEAACRALKEHGLNALMYCQAD